MHQPRVSTDNRVIPLFYPEVSSGRHEASVRCRNSNSQANGVPVSSADWLIPVDGTRNLLAELYRPIITATPGMMDV
jgi:hypothetical protein